MCCIQLHTESPKDWAPAAPGGELTSVSSIKDLQGSAAGIGPLKQSRLMQGE